MHNSSIDEINKDELYQSSSLFIIVILVILKRIFIVYYKNIDRFLQCAIIIV